MMLKKEHEILLPFIKEPWNNFTFKQIKEYSGKTSESYIYSSLKNFVKSGLLKEHKVGNVIQYSLKLSSTKTCSYCGFILEYNSFEKKHIPYRDLEELASKIPVHYYTLIITGSYSRNLQKKESDLDIVIIIEDSSDVKKVYAELRFFCEMNIPQIHLYVFRKSEFLSMLLDDKHNYGKEIVKNNLIISGGQSYYKIIREAIKNGFDGKYTIRKG